MRYIFMAGAPGSKWSSVCKSIYFSKSIDYSDFSNERTYWHSAWGEPQLMHLGAYFDPGMEFGDEFDSLPYIPKEEVEAEFDRPFSLPTGRRIIKSHMFCYYSEYLKKEWSDCPIILVHRPDDACLGWWVKCGHFDITYPKYGYYENLRQMALHIHNQNVELKRFIEYNKVITVNNSWELCDLLQIQRPHDTFQSYKDCDINVYLYWRKYE